MGCGNFTKMTKADNLCKLVQFVSIFYSFNCCKRSCILY